MKVFSFLDQTIYKTTLYFAVILMILMTVVSFYQVVARFVFMEPSAWTEIIARMFNVWMVYLGMVYASRFGAMMAVDVLPNLLNESIRKILLVSVGLVSVVIFVVVGWYGYQLALRAQFQNIPGLSIPMSEVPVSISWLYAALPVGAFLSATSTLFHILSMFGCLPEKEAGEPIAAQ